MFGKKSKKTKKNKEESLKKADESLLPAEEGQGAQEHEPHGDPLRAPLESESRKTSLKRSSKKTSTDSSLPAEEGKGVRELLKKRSKKSTTDSPLPTGEGKGVRALSGTRAEKSPEPEPHGDPLREEVVEGLSSAGKKRAKKASSKKPDPAKKTRRSLTPDPSPAGRGEDLASSEISHPETVEASSEHLTDHDVYLFNEGTHQRLYDKLGAHVITRDGARGVHFAVWAPSAREVSVIGEFNGWSRSSHPLEARGGSGIWEGFFPEIPKGTMYKYHIASRHGGYEVAKTDPFGFRHETPPSTASIVWDLEYEWNDADWMKERESRNSLNSPMSIYEVHLGSWRRVPEDGGRPLTYRETADQLVEYVRESGFTHVEFLPVMEHPFYGSWGYQSTGYFAPTSRFGTPQDFMHLVDTLHQNGIGVILDWVPSHFPTDEHGLGYFDGTHLFEHADPRQGFHPDWSSLIFNYGRNEVRSFLISSAMFWLDKYHVDGIRVDAVASMLYLDYSRKAGEWIPNQYGGRDNIEALNFLRQLNEAVYGNFPGTQTIAEESTAWPMVSRPTYLGGLGFGLKWDMGWMHDTLRYFSHEPIYRTYHHNELTFRSIYAFTENFMLPLSHDEVVHGKGSLIRKMPGDDWQKFANLRLLFSYMYAQPGKKLVFMGGEFGQWKEWNHDDSLEWHLTEQPFHGGVQRAVSDLNRLYRDSPALHADVQPEGFEWLDANDSQQSVLSFIRKSADGEHMLIALFNFTPVIRYNYRVGAPVSGFWTEAFNSDAIEYGGSGQGNLGRVEAAPIPYHGRRYSLNVTLPPLGAVFFASEEMLD